MVLDGDEARPGRIDPVRFERQSENGRGAHKAKVRLWREMPEDIQHTLFRGR
jgi:hypothetical protein